MKYINFKANPDSLEDLANFKNEMVQKLSEISMQGRENELPIEIGMMTACFWAIECYLLLGWSRELITQTFLSQIDLALKKINQSNDAEV